MIFQYTNQHVVNGMTKDKNYNTRQQLQFLFCTLLHVVLLHNLLYRHPVLSETVTARKSLFGIFLIWRSNTGHPLTQDG